MNINVPEKHFNEVKKSLFNIDIENSTIDTNIKPVLERLRKSPIIETICPRWSCEGHDESFSMSDYEIIFCTIGNQSFEILYDMFTKLSEEYQKLTGECVSVRIKIVNLVFNYSNEFYPHVALNITTIGDSTRIENSVIAWNNMLDYIETKYENKK